MVCPFLLFFPILFLGTGHRFENIKERDLLFVYLMCKYANSEERGRKGGEKRERE